MAKGPDNLQPSGALFRVPARLRPELGKSSFPAPDELLREEARQAQNVQTRAALASLRNMLGPDWAERPSVKARREKKRSSQG